jgi:hypothetical protein
VWIWVLADYGRGYLRDLPTGKTNVMQLSECKGIPELLASRDSHFDGESGNKNS